jgi:hypothetical protein
MSDCKRRLDAIRCLVVGSVVSADHDYTNILGELNEVERVRKVVEKARRRLLQILHTTRTLDSLLLAYMRQKGIALGHNTMSLGGYLNALSANGRITTAAVQRYQRNIVDVRNRYMHPSVPV